ncbi:RluA family pseudouridine synthase [Ruminococcaceae bacterium OttesenSCG-928-D13]|nr:RluA family pseudouridine synthase [Ruminococcaceae bacterium OttesenSCG-928-D13]
MGRTAMETIEYLAVSADEGVRLDSFIAAHCGLSRSVSQQLVEAGNVLVNGKAAGKGKKLAEGDRLAITIPPPRESTLVAQDIPLDVVYEDPFLLVVNKPKGMVVHPAPGNPDGTLVNALLHHCAGSLSGIGGELRPGIVHRIDKDTSGLLVVAKDDETHRGLSEQFAEHSSEREYDAVVYGGFRESTGEIDAPIGRSRADRKKMAVTETNSKSAVTTYRVVESFDGFTHLKLRLKTGRTHQIRVHMAEIGHPLAGDEVYGPRKVIKRLNGQCLHAGMLGFTHPQTGERVRFESPLPPYFTAFVAGLTKK